MLAGANFEKYWQALEKNKVPKVESPESAHTAIVVIEGVYQVGASPNSSTLMYMRASCGPYYCFLIVAL